MDLRTSNFVGKTGGEWESFTVEVTLNKDLKDEWENGRWHGKGRAFHSL
jgi:hypothetical protein